MTALQKIKTLKLGTMLRLKMKVSGSEFVGTVISCNDELYWLCSDYTSLPLKEVINFKADWKNEFSVVKKW